MALGVEATHDLHVLGHRRGQVLAAPQPADALFELARLARLGRVQAEAARTGVGVDEAEGLVLDRHVLEHLHQHQVFQDVGVVAGVEGVTIGEHGQLSRAPGARARRARG